MNTIAIPQGAIHALDRIEVVKLTEKEEIKAQIAIAILAFEAKGGKIERVAQGASGPADKTNRIAAARGRKSTLLISGSKGPGSWK